MSGQTTSHLLMIRPVQFAFNTDTASNNSFQSINDADAQQLALKEFDDFVFLLRSNDIDVTVIHDTQSPHTPDSIFPNNWISFHDNGSIVLYPMFAPNRRQERKPHVLDELNKKFLIDRQHDFTKNENKNIFLEGTGSMVLDRENKIAYACISERTDKNVLAEVCKQIGFEPETFLAVDAKGFPIYHTNVMMCVADKFAVVCFDTILDPIEKKSVSEKLLATKEEIIGISLDQMNRFAGNMLQVHNAHGKKFLVMSTQAFGSLTVDQKMRINRYNPILHSSLDAIERNGGGSARCMMAEVFLSLRPQ